MISLSIEYYQSHLDDTPIDSDKDTVKNTIVKSVESENHNKVIPKISENKNEVSQCVDSEVEKVSTESNGDKIDSNEPAGDNQEVEGDEVRGVEGKRFLKCPAAVSMQLLQKFVRMKFGLTLNHRVSYL